MTRQSLKHLLIRYSDKLAPPEGMIHLHNQMIKDYGYVWMGKFGRPISENNLNMLKLQIEQKKPTYLFLVQKFEKNYLITVAEIASFSKSLIREELDKVPSYYRQNHKNVGTWFKIKKFYNIDNSILTKTLIASSGIPAIKTLPYSMTGFFIVRLEQSNLAAEFNMKPI